mmetsp:Transcript_3668/g.7022  ORF Transcript_3668/g.7022 Transcript_3668/m.7022 type:complete len:212 (-) Transcript_3668:132-767(-)
MSFFLLLISTPSERRNFALFSMKNGKQPGDGSLDLFRKQCLTSPLRSRLVAARGNVLDSRIVSVLISDEHIMRFRMCGVRRVRLIQKILDSKKDLLDSNRRSPAFIGIQDTQAYRSRGVNIWVEQRRTESTFRRSTRIILRKFHDQLKQSSFPQRPVLSRNPTLPLHHIHLPILIRRLCKKTHRMILPPIPSLLLQSRPRNPTHYLQRQQQ